MTLYAESSAVLAWLLEQDRGPVVKRILAASDLVVASDLTLIECDRALLRATTFGRISSEDQAERQKRLATTAAFWGLLPIGGSIVERVRQPFPDDAIRSLDAIHLASALIARPALGDLDILSLDHRIRATATRLGFHVLPE